MSKRMAAYLAAAACVAVLWSAPALLAQAAGQDNAARKGSAYMTVLRARQLPPPPAPPAAPPIPAPRPIP